MPLHRYGRRTPKNAPAVPFAAFAAALPPAPAEYDSVAGWTGWKMLGNGPDAENAANGVPSEGAGDCVSVSDATEERIVTNRAKYQSLAQVIKFYKTQNPGFPAEDNGMDIQTALEYLHQHGRPDDGVKSVAFAKVDHTDVAAIRLAVSNFKCVWLGVNVTEDNENQFPSTAWTPTGQVLGGHSIILTGYRADGTFHMQTWADEGSLSPGFMVNGSGNRAGVEEAWVVVWPEHLEGLSDEALTALADAYKAVTGSTLPVVVTPPPTPTPVPTPTPTPTPTPVPTPVADLSELVTLLRHFVNKVEKFLESHGI